MILIHDIPLGYIISLLKPGKFTCQLRNKTWLIY